MSENKLIPSRNISDIKNKQKRFEEYLKLKKQKRQEKLERRKIRQAAKELGTEIKVPQQRTLENTREPDETYVQADDEEVKLDIETDEVSSVFTGKTTPKVLITCSENPHHWTTRFCKELKHLIHNADFFLRRHCSIKKLIKEAAARNYTTVIVVNEDRRHPNAMLVTHLPEGPTAYFRVSNVKYCKQIKRRASSSKEKPEIFISNVHTRLGVTVGRLLQSLFDIRPQFAARRVVTFHNQRDYIFVRNHRYEFKNDTKVAIQEIGPRFTLRLRALQKNTFDSKFGEFEWVLKRHEMETSRRRFFL